MTMVMLLTHQIQQGSHGVCHCLTLIGPVEPTTTMVASNGKWLRNPAGRTVLNVKIFR